jgi:small subunit ribosomal protein S3
MGRKVHPVGFRLGITSEWESKWFAEKQYTELLHEDLAIRKLIMKELTRASIARIDLERSANNVEVTLHTVIGKQGANVERLRKLIEKEVGKKVNLKIEEIKVPETNARLIAESIAEQITRRVAYRRAMKHAIQQAMRRGAKGVKVRMSGRLGGAEMSRTVSEMEGRVPLHTLRADIEFATVHAHTTYGRIGVKVWVYKGDVMPQRDEVTAASLTADLANAGD